MKAARQQGHIRWRIARASSATRVLEAGEARRLKKHKWKAGVIGEVERTGKARNALDLGLHGEDYGEGIEDVPAIMSSTACSSTGGVFAMLRYLVGVSR